MRVYIASKLGRMDDYPNFATLISIIYCIVEHVRTTLYIYNELRVNNREDVS